MWFVYGYWEVISGKFESIEFLIIILLFLLFKLVRVMLIIVLKRFENVRFKYNRSEFVVYVIGLGGYILLLGGFWLITLFW